MAIDYILKLYLQVFLISYLQVLDQIVCVDQVVNSTNYKFEFPSPADRSRAPIISFSDASSGYPGGSILFSGIDLDNQVATLRLGLPFVPSHLGQAGSIDYMIQRVDFASTSDVISTSVFYISIGTNDYIRYYLWNVSDVQSCYLPWSFNQFLAQTMKQETKNLYNAHVRKVVVMGLAPIGCSDSWLYHSNNGQCVATINDMILEYLAERYIVAELKGELVGASVIFCDVFEGSIDIIQNHDRYGFYVTDEAWKYKDWILISPEMACSNSSNHIWWDQSHLTDAANAILSDNNLYNANVRKVVVMGLDPIDCAAYYLWLYHSKNGRCVETIIDMILEFNFAVRYIVAELNEELVGATVIFCDAFEGSMDIIQNHDRYGFNVTDEACCGLGNIQKLDRVDNWKSPLVGLISSN